MDDGLDLDHGHAPGQHGPRRGGPAGPGQTMPAREVTSGRRTADREILSADVPAHPEFVGVVRQLVRSVGNLVSGIAPGRIDDLVVAASEAATNAIEAHAAAGDARPIRLEVQSSPRRVEVRVTDRGAGFEPAELPVRPPHGDLGHLRIERGWGIQLMRALVDHVEFRRSPEGMEIRLVLETADR